MYTDLNVRDHVTIRRPVYVQQVILCQIFMPPREGSSCSLSWGLHKCTGTPFLSCMLMCTSIKFTKIRVQSISRFEIFSQIFQIFTEESSVFRQKVTKHSSHFATSPPFTSHFVVFSFFVFSYHIDFMANCEADQLMCLLSVCHQLNGDDSAMDAG